MRPQRTRPARRRAALVAVTALLGALAVPAGPSVAASTGWKDISPDWVTYLHQNLIRTAS